MKKIKVKMDKPAYLGLPILEISQTLMYEFWYDYVKPKYQKMLSYVTWIMIILLLILKLKMFRKTLQMMLKKDLTHQIMK